MMWCADESSLRIVKIFSFISEVDAVNQFAVLRRGSSHFELSWERPYIISGRLLGYDVVYRGEYNIPVIALVRYYEYVV